MFARRNGADGAGSPGEQNPKLSYKLRLNTLYGRVASGCNAEPQGVPSTGVSHHRGRDVDVCLTVNGVGLTEFMRQIEQGPIMAPDEYVDVESKVVLGIVRELAGDALRRQHSGIWDALAATLFEDLCGKFCGGDESECADCFRTLPQSAAVPRFAHSLKVYDRVNRSYPMNGEVLE